MAYTKGPWKTLAGDWDKDNDGYCRYTISPLRELNMADARLIAAAPELLEALKDALATAEECCEDTFGTPTSQFFHDKAEKYRAVIEKVEGTK